MFHPNKKCLFHITIGAFSCHLWRVKSSQAGLTSQGNPVPQQALTWGYVPVRQAKPPCIRAHWGGPDSSVDPDDFPGFIKPDSRRIVVDDGESPCEFLTRLGGVGPERTIQKDVKTGVAIGPVVDAVLADAMAGPRVPHPVRA